MNISIRKSLVPSLTLLAISLASCGSAASVDSGSQAAKTSAGSIAAKDSQTETKYPSEPKIQHIANLDEPWAMAFEPGTDNLFVTLTTGSIRLVTSAGKIHTVAGAPKVDYGGQGGLGDIAFAPAYSENRQIYLSWVEAGTSRKRGAAVGRGKLICPTVSTCRIDGLEVIWRQTPKVAGRGHYSHRLAFSPDGQYLFVASGDRQEKEPAQDNSNTLGTIVRLNLDGTAAAGNPFADKGSPTDQIWSYGHRNVLGLEFDSSGNLWDVEHGPVGGDELNLVKAGSNYGWPIVSDGNHYNGDKIPRHDTRPDLAGPAISWTPVIAPSGMIIYSGKLFADWRGQFLISGLKSRALIRVENRGGKAAELARYPMGDRMRAIVEAPDGAIWMVEEGEDAKLLRIVPAS